MWDIYNALIAGIPDYLTADTIICGTEFAFVANKIGIGLSDVLRHDRNHTISKGNLIGAPLRQVAELIKSWNFPEAAIGLAAINSYYNSPEIAEMSGVVFSESYDQEKLNNPIIAAQDDLKDKRVAAVGNLPNLKTNLEHAAKFSIVEWEPILSGEYPFSACEYILPECDYVFISARSLVDKSLPRLLELSKNALRTFLLGPGTPLAPCLLKTTLCDLSGFVVTDSQMAMRIVAGAENTRIFRAGQKVKIEKSEANR